MLNLFKSAIKKEPGNRQGEAISDVDAFLGKGKAVSDIVAPIDGDEGDLVIKDLDKEREELAKKRSGTIEEGIDNGTGDGEEDRASDDAAQSAVGSIGLDKPLPEILDGPLGVDDIDGIPQEPAATDVDPDQWAPKNLDEGTASSTSREDVSQEPEFSSNLDDGQEIDDLMSPKSSTLPLDDDEVGDEFIPRNLDEDHDSQGAAEAETALDDVPLTPEGPDDHLDEMSNGPEDGHFIDDSQSNHKGDDHEGAGEELHDNPDSSDLQDGALTPIEETDELDGSPLSPENADLDATDDRSNYDEPAGEGSEVGSMCQDENVDDDGGSHFDGEVSAETADQDFQSDNGERYSDMGDIDDHGLEGSNGDFAEDAPLSATYSGEEDFNPDSDEQQPSTPQSSMSDAYSQQGDKFVGENDDMGADEELDAEHGLDFNDPEGEPREDGEGSVGDEGFDGGHERYDGDGYGEDADFPEDEGAEPGPYDAEGIEMEGDVDDETAFPDDVSQRDGDDDAERGLDQENDLPLDEALDGDEDEDEDPVAEESAAEDSAADDERSESGSHQDEAESDDVGTDKPLSVPGREWTKAQMESFKVQVRSNSSLFEFFARKGILSRERLSEVVAESLKLCLKDPMSMHGKTHSTVFMEASGTPVGPFLAFLALTVQSMDVSQEKKGKGGKKLDEDESEPQKSPKSPKSPSSDSDSDEDSEADEWGDLNMDDDDLEAPQSHLEPPKPKDVPATPLPPPVIAKGTKVQTNILVIMFLQAILETSRAAISGPAKAYLEWTFIPQSLEINSKDVDCKDENSGSLHMKHSKTTAAQTLSWGDANPLEYVSVGTQPMYSKQVYLHNGNAKAQQAAHMISMICERLRESKTMLSEYDRTTFVIQSTATSVTFSYAVFSHEYIKYYKLEEGLPSTLNDEMDEIMVDTVPELKIFETEPYDLSKTDQALEAAELSLAMVEFLQKNGPLLSSQILEDHPEIEAKSLKRASTMAFDESNKPFPIKINPQKPEEKEPIPEDEEDELHSEPDEPPTPPPKDEELAKETSDVEEEGNDQKDEELSEHESDMGKDPELSEDKEDVLNPDNSMLEKQDDEEVGSILDDHEMSDYEDQDRELGSQIDDYEGSQADFDDQEVTDNEQDAAETRYSDDEGLDGSNYDEQDLQASDQDQDAGSQYNDDEEYENPLGEEDLKSNYEDGESFEERNGQEFDEEENDENLTIDGDEIYDDEVGDDQQQFFSDEQDVFEEGVFDEEPRGESDGDEYYDSQADLDPEDLDGQSQLLDDGVEEELGLEGQDLYSEEEGAEYDQEGDYDEEERGFEDQVNESYDEQEGSVLDEIDQYSDDQYDDPEGLDQGVSDDQGAESYDEEQDYEDGGERQIDDYDNDEDVEYSQEGSMYGEESGLDGPDDPGSPYTVNDEEEMEIEEQQRMNDNEEQQRMNDNEDYASDASDAVDEFGNPLEQDYYSDDAREDELQDDASQGTIRGGFEDEQLAEGEDYDSQQENYGEDGYDDDSQLDQGYSDQDVNEESLDNELGDLEGSVEYEPSVVDSQAEDFQSDLGDETHGGQDEYSHHEQVEYDDHEQGDYDEDQSLDQASTFEDEGAEYHSADQDEEEVDDQQFPEEESQLDGPNYEGDGYGSRSDDDQYLEPDGDDYQVNEERDLQDGNPEEHMDDDYPYDSADEGSLPFGLEDEIRNDTQEIEIGLESPSADAGDTPQPETQKQILPDQGFEFQFGDQNQDDNQDEDSAEDTEVGTFMADGGEDLDPSHDQLLENDGYSEGGEYPEDGAYSEGGEYHEDDQYSEGELYPADGEYPEDVEHAEEHREEEPYADDGEYSDNGEYPDNGEEPDNDEYPSENEQTADIAYEGSQPPYTPSQQLFSPTKSMAESNFEDGEDLPDDSSGFHQGAQIPGFFLDEATGKYHPIEEQEANENQDQEDDDVKRVADEMYYDEDSATEPALESPKQDLEEEEDHEPQAEEEKNLYDGGDYGGEDYDEYYHPQQDTEKDAPIDTKTEPAEDPVETEPQTEAQPSLAEPPTPSPIPTTTSLKATPEPSPRPQESKSEAPSELDTNYQLPSARYGEDATKSLTVPGLSSQPLPVPTAAVPPPPQQAPPAPIPVPIIPTQQPRQPTKTPPPIPPLPLQALPTPPKQPRMPPPPSSLPPSRPVPPPPPPPKTPGLPGRPGVGLKPGGGLRDSQSPATLGFDYAKAAREAAEKEAMPKMPKMPVRPAYERDGL